ncbi:MAG: Asp-tRNA(Asn)/Glu-tRNA(Gln) amidotransferase subunit GatC [Phycisphaera sp.]|nr:Asp-tRNA(Asn)/Glu-tRNA(Gln) amidotransferase subunit GatC [Phycisphaera sp.]
MSERLTDDDVKKVAKLARLKLNDEQIHAFAGQLSDVLSYVHKLDELDVTGVEPMAHPTDMTNRFRDDTPGRPISVDQALANAPESDPPFFKVPKVLGDGGGA